MLRLFRELIRRLRLTMIITVLESVSLRSNFDEALFADLAAKLAPEKR